MLVGRTRELNSLVQRLDEIQAHGARAVLVSGEPGIGKTSLLTALREEARKRGLAVASVASDDQSWLPPYTPWSSILEQLGQPPAQTTFPNDADNLADDYRFWMSRSIERSIRDAAARPIVITLDDIQWLDGSSLGVLAFLIARLGTAPVLLVAAWRAPVSTREPVFPTFVAAQRRAPATHWLDLAGLDEPEVAALVRQLGQPASPAAIRRLTVETKGNPFFISEMVRLGLDRKDIGGDPEPNQPGYGIPPSIRDVVRLRHDRLPERTQHMLSVAAILTHGFDFAILREMTDLDETALLDAIDDALDSDFLHPTDLRPEHYDFTHGIVREAIAAGWSPSRRARLHRRAAEALERHFAGRHAQVAGDLAAHYFASRSIEGAIRGLPYALAGAEQASRAFDFGRAAELLTWARDLAVSEPAAIRADIEWRRAVALAEALRIDDAVAAAERTIELWQDAGAQPDIVAHACWRVAHALKAVGADEAIRNRLQRAGLRVLGDRRDIHWARLRLLSDPIEPVPNDALFVARWAGYDAEAQRIARQGDNDEDVAQTIESFDPRNPYQTRNLITQARAWHQPRATLRGLTAAANDLTYRHGEFRQAMSLWNEVLTTARRIGTIPWQANALNQITLLHVTLGEFEGAVASKRLADEVNGELGPASDAEALSMERDFALTHYLDGDWPGQASYWLRFVGDPPHGLEAQLAVPLYAAMAASAASRAGDRASALRLVDELAAIVAYPGIQQVNGVVAWAADAIAQLGASDRAATFDRLAASIIASGMRDFPQTSLGLTRARMLTLLDDPLAQRMFDGARETLAAQSQAPLLGIACYEQAIAPTTSIARRKPLLRQATGIFSRLGMTTWHDRAMAKTAAPADDHPDLTGAGVTRRELEVLRLVAQGYSDRRVADELYISERTVHAHLRNMLYKTETANRTELSSWARRKGILDA